MIPDRTALIDWIVSRAVAIVILIFVGVSIGVVCVKREQDDEPCRYGAAPMMVTEKDGRARVVCGCPRGSTTVAAP